MIHAHRFWSVPRRAQIRQRRGAMLVLVALLLVVFLVTVAFSVDVAHMQLTRTQLRSATDAAARASGEALSRTQDAAAARNAAKDLAARNRVAGRPLVLGDEDIIFGSSSPNSSGSWVFTAGAEPINSIRINGRRTSASLSGAVPLFFGPIFGVDFFEPQLSATVVRLDRDICLIVDRSSSMKLPLTSTGTTINLADGRVFQPPYPDSRWAALCTAVQAFTAALQTTPQTERVALGSFASDFPLLGVNNRAATLDQNFTEDPTRINTALSTISSTVFNGMTNTAAGIDQGVAALSNTSVVRPYAFKTMIFLTDGFSTAGRPPIEAAYEAAAKKITVHTITFGATFDHTEMRALAAATGGKHFHAPNATELQNIFREIAFTLPVVFAE